MDAEPDARRRGCAAPPYPPLEAEGHIHTGPPSRVVAPAASHDTHHAPHTPPRPFATRRPAARHQHQPSKVSRRHHRAGANGSRKGSEGAPPSPYHAKTPVFEGLEGTPLAFSQDSRKPRADYTPAEAVSRHQSTAADRASQPHDRANAAVEDADEPRADKVDEVAGQSGDAAKRVCARDSRRTRESGLWGYGVSRD